MLSENTFVDALKSDLNYSAEFQRLFRGIEKPEQLDQILGNKDSLVENKISSCPVKIKGVFQVEDLIEKGLISKTGIEEILVIRPFSLDGSFVGHKITIGGPVYLDKNVVIGRSVISGPAAILESSRIHDSHLRGGKDGSVYIGRSCALWDFTVIIRSFIGDNSLIHTCNVNDSIVGSDCQLGAARTIVDFEEFEKTNSFNGINKLDSRIVICNFSQGNKIRIFNPTNDTLCETGKEHFGAIIGTGVWMGSGTITYPGTIIGTKAKINSTIPVVGYVPPRHNCTVFLSVKKNKKGKSQIQLKGGYKIESNCKKSCNLANNACNATEAAKHNLVKVILK